MAAHPLTRPASWTLTVGAPDAWLFRLAGAVLWAAGAVTGVVWLLALTSDALTGHVHPVYLLAAWPAVAAWLVLAWRIWRRWSSGAQALTLEWRGPVTRNQGRACVPGGFHVGEWREPVRVRVALSWQGWLLLSLERVRDGAGEGGGRVAGLAPTYAWLNARESDAPQATSRNRSLHQLRTLLHLPPAMTTQEEDPSAEAGLHDTQMRQPVASWTESFNSGSMLRRLARSIRSDRPSSAITPSRQDTAFPVTTVMTEHRMAKHPLRVREGGRG